VDPEGLQDMASWTGWHRIGMGMRMGTAKFCRDTLVWAKVCAAQSASDATMKLEICHELQTISDRGHKTSGPGEFKVFQYRSTAVPQSFAHGTKLISLKANAPENLA